MAEDPEPPPFLDLSRLVDGPFVVTFTAHLPFPVGVPQDLGHVLLLGQPFKDASAAEVFGPRPWVKVRVFDTVEQGLPMWRKGTHAALNHFYGVQLDDSEEARYGKDQFRVHDQWVTLETPHAALEGEDPATDRAFSFHRCVTIFNLFLQTALILTGDVRIRTISTHDLRPVVIIGALEQGREWRHLSVMYMHGGEARPEGLLITEKPFSEGELNEGMYAIITNKPYMNTAIWRSRAQRALRQTGDAADAIISFQVAAESMLFDTYRMLLVDDGLSSVEITSQLSEDIPFKTLLTWRLPEKLGGLWDVTRAEAPIGQYWANLYLVRNSIIHTGIQPNNGHAQAAQAAYWALRDFLESRLWEKRKTYSRTLYVRVGKEQLAERGWLTSPMQRIIDDIDKGPQPFYWPYDLRDQPDHETGT
jgi:hypothetical protein